MGRPPRFTEQQMLDAALDLLAREGPDGLSMAAIARQLRAPSGSIYHRFRSRDVLVATLWVRTVERFQDHYLAAFDEPDPILAARDAAARVLRWSQEHPNEVRLLMLHRSEDLLSGEWPDELVAQNHAQRDRIVAAVGDLGARLGATSTSDRRRLVFACVEVPTAEVRQRLAAGKAPDRTSLALVDETVVALLAPYRTD